MSATTDFTASVGIVVEMIKSLRAQGVNGQELMVEINNKLHDETLFNKAQRPNVLKAVNKSLGTKYSLSQIKRAVQGTPQAAVRVDELHGSTNLETQSQEGTRMNVQENNETSTVDLAAAEASKAIIVAAMVAAGYGSQIDRALLVDAFMEAIPATAPVVSAKVKELGTDDTDMVIGQLCMDPFFNMAFAKFVSDNKKPSAVAVVKEAGAEEPATTAAAEAVQEPVVEAAATERKRNVDTFSSKPAASKPELTQENTNMNQSTIRSITPNADRIRAAHGEKRDDSAMTLTADELKSVLQQAGATSEEATVAMVGRFFTKFPAMKPSFDSLGGNLEAWVAADTGNSLAFMTFARSEITGEQQPAAPAPATITDRVMTTLRGNRKEGFSSGVVAAAAAVVGGGIEMAVRGDVSIGSAVGTALGATAGYFAANAAEDLMESETGRYLLSGSIGLVAGGLGSRGGNLAQSALLASSQEMETTIQQIPEAHRPQGTLAAPVITGSLFR